MAQPSLEELAELQLRAGEGDTEFVSQFLDRHPQAVNLAVLECPLLCRAAFDGSVELVRLLVERGADINRPDGDGDSPLMNAIIGKRRDVVDYLLQSGAEIGEKELKYGSAMGFLGERKSGGCYIATACYGGYDHPDVMVLRRVRDERLLGSRAGRALVRLYYAASPPLAARLGNTEWLAVAIRRHCLEPLVRYCSRFLE